MSHPITVDYATLPMPLDHGERVYLDRLEAVIRDGLQTFYAVGEALVTIRNQHLYRAAFRTFEEYCQKKWRIDRASAYRMMDAAKVKENLSPNGDAPLPTNESQVRALKAAPPEKQADVWNQARATAPAGKVTANHIAQIVQTVMPPPPEPPPAAPARQISVFVPADMVREPEPAAQERGAPAPPVKDCHTCEYHKRMGNPKPGVRIPDGQGKCTRPDGHCDPDIVTGYLGEETPRIRHPDIVNPPTAPAAEPRLSELHVIEAFRPLMAEPPTAAPLPKNTVCPFCGCGVPQASVYRSERNGLTAVICRTCASTALHALLDPADPDIRTELSARSETFITEQQSFGWQQDDRAKIIKAGLRIVRPGGRMGVHELNELLPMKSGAPSYSWQIIERFASQAAIKRRLKELSTDPQIVIECRL